MIKGMPVILYEKIKVGTDPFKRPVYEENPVVVENVLVASSSADDVATSLSLTGKKAVYVLGIPKGDTHVWEDRKVKFFGRIWKTFGIPLEGMEEHIPLSWNKKVMVERYE